MRPHSFLRASLALPIIVPLAAYASGATSAISFLLVASLVFGAIPYAVTAGILWWLVGRCNTVRGLVYTVLIAPIAFSLLQAIMWSLLNWHDYLGYPSPSGPIVVSMSTSLALAGYGLAFGYAYVLLVLSAFFAAIRAKLVALPRPHPLAPAGDAA